MVLLFYQDGAVRTTSAGVPVMPTEKRWLNPDRADRHGLVAVGGSLDVDTMLLAYRRGIFPWFGPRDPVCWWSPDPRAIFDLDTFRPSHRLARTVRSGKFTTTLDRDFAGVVAGCADRPLSETWITPSMVEAYHRLHAIGHAHSVECWRGGELAGGVFGVTVGGLFAGESMFHRRTDASKVALCHLVERLRGCGFVLFDVQMVTPHTARLGAVEVSRAEYLARLAVAVGKDVGFTA
jgi:leucyl/phenylalanyl-tRNA--protein transferase